ncbi:hypothetical protein N7490_001263 [Penicillium lividum]|nr:hypothetical protein N7490_001263 [Penicillium lividum]
MLTDTLKDRSWLRIRGARVSRWLENPDEPNCPIPQNTLTPDEIEQKATKFDRFPNVDILLAGHTLLLPPEWPACQTRGSYTYYSMRFNRDSWSGFTTAGILIIQAMRRVQPVTPHPSEVGLSLYAKEQGLDELRYVFATTIINWQTSHFVTVDLYSVWPGEARTWEFGSKEYEELLGTRIGRTVAYLVLGGFERGSRRIARIVTYCEDVGACGDLNIRFDIEPNDNLA